MYPASGVVPDSVGILPARWRQLNPHGEQKRAWDAPTAEERFQVFCAGKRSGKSEIAKRKLVREAIKCRWPGAWFFATAPTREQAKGLYWDDLKAMFPAELLSHRPNETDLHMRTIFGVHIVTMGMDKPMRVEGKPIAGIVMDEFQEMRADAWPRYVRSSLSTPTLNGWAMLLFRPKGQNHAHDLYRFAETHTSEGWGAYRWKSAALLDQAELDRARAEMDPRMFAEQYEAEFLDSSLKAYHCFDRSVHAKDRLAYVPELPLIFTFDFNREPGCAGVIQEQHRDVHLRHLNRTDLGDVVSCAIGQVWIPRNSLTKYVCDKLVADWKHHKGEVWMYGDASGGAGGSNQVQGSDWHQVREILGAAFGDRLTGQIARANPKVKPRVNSLNARLRTADGKVHMLVDPVNADQVAEDLDKTSILEGADFELDKDSAPMTTHMTDGVGYYTFERFFASLGREVSME